jgi:inorganic pyrophosphatase
MAASTNIPKDYATRYLGRSVHVQIDRQLGTPHPTHGWHYPINYGFLPGTLAPDGEPVDVYALGWDKPMESLGGIVVAVVRRLDDDDDKLVVTRDGESFTEAQIEKAIEFQEKYFTHKLLFPEPAAS